ncbi:PH domain-containing protein [Muricoccus radiodurans]|uniref:PH domain-containing protein n=1 Tax=Muricoccus radiodurans TaxID=2231721 RepID=UPI003CF90AA2
MGLFNAILGHSSDVDTGKLDDEFATILVPGESIAAAYRVVRDMLVFTDRRLILVDRQGVTGRKTEYLSIPFREVARFSVETAGTFDMEAELKIWLRGVTEPIARTFPRGGGIAEVHRTIAACVLGK